MKQLTSMLDKIANELESIGLRKLAFEVDTVANALSTPPLAGLEKASQGVRTIEQADSVAKREGLTEQAAQQMYEKLPPEVRKKINEIMNGGTAPGEATASVKSMAAALVLALAMLGHAGAPSANKVPFDQQTTQQKFETLAEWATSRDGKPVPTKQIDGVVAEYQSMSRLNGGYENVENFLAFTRALEAKSTPAETDRVLKELFPSTPINGEPLLSATIVGKLIGVLYTHHALTPDAEIMLRHGYDKQEDEESKGWFIRDAAKSLVKHNTSVSLEQAKSIVSKVFRESPAPNGR